MTIFMLVLAIAFEAGWALAMKSSNGFTRPGPTIACIVMYVLSLVFLTFATKHMDVGAAYAIWAGSGVALIAIGGILMFNEPATLLKGASIALVVLGIVGINLSGAGHSNPPTPVTNTPSPAPAAP